MLYADDLAVVEYDLENFKEKVKDWKSIFEAHGLRVSREKTEVLTVDKATDECVDVTLDCFKLKQVRSFKDLGSMVDAWNKGKCEIKRREQAALMAWQRLKRTMYDKRV